MPGHFGVVQIGRLSLREDDGVDFILGDDARTAVLTVSGQESVDRLGFAVVKKRLDEIVGLNRTFVPVVFSHKNELNGFYRVISLSGTSRKWQEQSANVVPWQLNLQRVGYANEVNIDSRLSGPITRTNDHSATGKRWHAPAGGHTAYSAGSTVPTMVTRTSTEGATLVYYNLAAGINPRWMTTPQNYGNGRCRFLDADGAERSASQAPYAATGWTATNGIVRLQVNATTGVFEISAWTGGAWQTKGWELFHSTGPAVTLGVPDAMSILRNDYEELVVRVTKALSPGRVTVDFTIKRGARFIEVYVQHQFGTTLKLVRSAPEATTASTGYLRATAADGAGNRIVVGSAKSFVADNVNGGISKAATPVLDAFVGVEVTAAPAGDAAADLFQQYLGSPAELIEGVRN